MSVRPPLLFYCQHSVGLGHLTRSYALCAHLAEWFRVVLVCGGSLPEEIDPPPGVEIVALPPLGVGAASRFVSHDPRFTVERAWAIRGELLLRTVRSVRPAVVFVELFPFGRAKFARELVPLLEAARTIGAVTACSLRDILVSRRNGQREHDERACALANAHLDAVLVHCDPAFARLEETFGAHAQLAIPVEYTGFVVAGPPAGQRRPRRIVVSAGGGLVGAPLLRAAAAAQGLLWPRTGLPMRLIAGPFCPDADRRALAGAAQPGLEVVRTVPDLGAELREAAASVSQCGYNTALELVRSGVPALVVPYATPEEDEQRRRARRLARLGAVRVLDPAGVEPETLAREIEGLVEFEPARPRLDLDGARTTTELLWRRVAPAVPEVRSA
jgi:predicted glycosyltransferase